MTVFQVSTKRKKEVVDITDLCRKQLTADKAGTGLCHLFVLHTTAALTIADLDPGTDLDLLDAFEALVPKLSYRHPHNPAHVGDHIMSSLIGTSLCVPVKNGELVLGTWQRLILVELDGPRSRELVLTFIREANAPA
jgi:secondary thiamine-phosphate synthase enzyme